MQLLGYLAFFLGICAVLLAGINLVPIHIGSTARFYFFCGAAIICFIISWWLSKISRKK